jgi:hypothetical protein
MMPTVKRGDDNPVTLDLGRDLSDYTSANVVMCRAGLDPYELAGTITPGTGGTVTVAIPDTAPVGDYEVEVEMAPGPHTYPSDGYVILSILGDLNP